MFLATCYLILWIIFAVAHWVYEPTNRGGGIVLTVLLGIIGYVLFKGAF
jgi:uncharacterized membrane protein YeaQ/YmgE (transglycosylase-associated protein family)